jgi:enoyl-[acyl-carrier protein] reductase II
MYAMMALGAEAVQMGTRFVCTDEGSGHVAFKQSVVNAGEGDTVLTLKQLTPVRLIKNAFYKEVAEAETTCMPVPQLSELLGHRRAKKGMFEGDLDGGELEIGQISSIVNSIRPAAEVVQEIWNEFCMTAHSPFGY